MLHTTSEQIATTPLSKQPRQYAQSWQRWLIPLLAAGAGVAAVGSFLLYYYSFLAPWLLLWAIPLLIGVVVLASKTVWRRSNYAEIKPRRDYSLSEMMIGGAAGTCFQATLWTALQVLNNSEFNFYREPIIFGYTLMFLALFVVTLRNGLSKSRLEIAIETNRGRAVLVVSILLAVALAVVGALAFDGWMNTRSAASWADQLAGARGKASQYISDPVMDYVDVQPTYSLLNKGYNNTLILRFEFFGASTGKNVDIQLNDASPGGTASKVSGSYYGQTLSADEIATWKAIAAAIKVSPRQAVEATLPDITKFEQQNGEGYIEPDVGLEETASIHTDQLLNTTDKALWSVMYISDKNGIQEIDYLVSTTTGQIVSQYLHRNETQQP